jgi:hypothetical protein
MVPLLWNNTSSPVPNHEFSNIEIQNEVIKRAPLVMNKKDDDTMIESRYNASWNSKFYLAK